MSEERNDGGPAFPETRWDDRTRQEVQWTGMALRDWFAGQALAGLLVGVNSPDWGACSKQAYMAADAMLEARDE